MIITTIGSSSGCSTAARDSAGVYIQSSKNILLDCGEATNKYFLDRDVNELDVVCITHAHIDHFIGLPMLLFHNLGIRGRTKPLTIIAPRSVETFMQAFYKEYHLQPEFDVHLKYYDSQYEYEFKHWHFGDVIIMACEVQHSMSECFGYSIVDKSDEISVFYTGDTEVFDLLPRICKSHDIIIAEGTWASDYHGPRYGHSWVKEMIECVDSNSDVSKLVLTHLSQRYHSENGYHCYSRDVADAFMHCKNLKRIYIAYDGLTIQI